MVTCNQRLRLSSQNLDILLSLISVAAILLVASGVPVAPELINNISTLFLRNKVVQICKTAGSRHFVSTSCDVKNASISAQDGAVIVQSSKTTQLQNSNFSFGSWPHFESWKLAWNHDYSILGQQHSRLNCSVWIEQPTLMVYSSFPANYWHALADTFATGFATLVEAGVWDDKQRSFKSCRINVQPFARHPSPYYSASGGNDYNKALRRFVSEGHFAVDRYKLLELLCGHRFLFESTSLQGSKLNDSDQHSFEQQPPNTCYRRLLVGFSATLDFNIDSRYLGKQGVHKRKAMVDFVLRKFSLPSVRAVDLPMRPLVTIINRSGGDRRFGNLDSVLQWLLDFGIGVEVVDFNKAPLSEVVSLMQRTTVLFGIHGAGFTNLAFLRPGAVVAMLQPTRTFSYFPDFFVNMAEAVGVSFVTRDIVCCSSRSEVHNVSRAEFVDMLGEVLQSGYHITMPKTWNLY